MSPRSNLFIARYRGQLLATVLAVLAASGVRAASPEEDDIRVSREWSIFVGQTPEPFPAEVEHVAVPEAGFETPSVTGSLYWLGDAPTSVVGTVSPPDPILSWIGDGNLNFGGPALFRNGSAWGFPPVPEGQQAVALQTDASIETEVIFDSAGLHMLRWVSAARDGQVNPFVVTLDGAVASPTLIVPYSSWWPLSVPLHVPTPGPHQLGFRALNSGGGDKTVGLDAVSLTRLIQQPLRPAEVDAAREMVSREISVHVEAGPSGLVSERVSREVSVVVDVPGPPPVVPDMGVRVSPIGDVVHLDWSAQYDPWRVGDVVAFQVFLSDTPFTALEGRVPFLLIPGDTLSCTLEGLASWQDRYFAVVPVDGLGQRIPDIVYSGAYVLMPENVSREAALFVGNGPDREAVSRELDLVVDLPGPPASVGTFGVRMSPTGETGWLDWSGYDPWLEQDVTGFRVYQSDAPIVSLEGVSHVTVPADRFQHEFQGLGAWQDHFFVVVPVDGLGGLDPGVRYRGGYVLMPEVVGRESGVFVGDEPDPPRRQWTTREVSLVVPDLTVPAPVTGLASGYRVSTPAGLREAVDLDWSSYDEDFQFDVVGYRCFVADHPFTSVTGMPGIDVVLGGARRVTLTNLAPASVWFAATVALDSGGQFNAEVYPRSTPSDVYSLRAVSGVSGPRLVWSVAGDGASLAVTPYVGEYRVYADWPIPTGIASVSAASGSAARRRLMSTAPALAGSVMNVVPAGERGWGLPPAPEASSMRLRVTVVDVSGNESPGVTLDLHLPRFVGVTNGLASEHQEYEQAVTVVHDGVPPPSVGVTMLEGPAGATFSGSVFRWVPGESDGGTTRSVTLVAFDGLFSVTNQFHIAVEETADTPVARVMGRHVFYNQSAFDGNNAAANAADDGAIAPDKAPLLPGGVGALANYTSYSRGLNGIMVDVSGLPGEPTASDFVLRSGNDANPAGWGPAPAPSSVALRRGAGVGGSDRVTLIWGSDAVRKKWLQVTVLPTAATGLGQADVFYFGNAVGETGNSSSDARVTAVDALRVLGNIAASAVVSSRFDINRDGRVGGADRLQILGNLAALEPLILLNLGGTGSLAAEPEPVSGRGPVLRQVIPVEGGVEVSWESQEVPVRILTAAAVHGAEWEVYEPFAPTAGAGQEVSVFLPVETEESGRLYRLEDVEVGRGRP